DRLVGVDGDRSAETGGAGEGPLGVCGNGGEGRAAGHSGDVDHDGGGAGAGVDDVDVVAQEAEAARAVEPAEVPDVGRGVVGVGASGRGRPVGADDRHVHRAHAGR